MHLISDAQREYLGTLTLRQRQKEILKEEYRNGEWYANDIREVKSGDLPTADCWCFGAPCQDFSIAGKRAGLGGDRSSLIREIFRLLEEQEEQDRPEWLIYENVKGMLSSNKGLDYLSILSEMDKLGYNIEWQNINSEWFVPQNRERIYTIGHFRRFGKTKILPITGTDGENHVCQLGKLYGTDRESNPSGGRVYSVNGVCLTTGNGHGMGQPQIGIPFFVDMNYGAGIKQTENARTLQGRYNKGMSNHSGETSGVAIPILIPGGNQERTIDFEVLGGVHTNPSPNYNRGILDEVSRTLKADSHSAGVALGIIDSQGRSKKRVLPKDICPTLRSETHGNHPNVILNIKEATKKGYAEARIGDSINLAMPDSKTRRGRVRHGAAQTLDTSCNQGTPIILVGDKPNYLDENNGIYVEMPDGFIVYAIWYEKEQCYIAIRKLTPKECFRLQGWTDDYFEKAAFVNSDSQLYKQAGNGVTVSVVRAIGEKLANVDV